VTIVCGYRPPGSERVWLASDSRSCGGEFIYPTVARKIVRVSGWLIGMSGPDLVDEFVYGLALGMPPELSAPEIRNRIWAAPKNAGWVPSHADESGPVCYPMALILARPGELLAVAADGSIWSPQDGFVAIGSGQDFAYGSFFPQSTDNGPHLIVRSAVMAAIRYRSDCGGEVVVESIG
jgi:hypothetical protein